MSNLFDRVKMTVSGTPGTGTITLGSAVTDASNGDYLSFANASVPTGVTVSYVAIYGHNWGKGRGMYTSAGTTLSRDAAEVTWNGSVIGNTPISLSSSTVVFLTAIFSDLPQVTETHIASSSATLDFTKFASSTFDVYDIELDNVFPSSSSAQWFKMLCSTNGGASWDTTAANYESTSNYSFANSTGGVGGTNIVAGGFVGAPVTNTNLGISGYARLVGLASTSLHKVLLFKVSWYYLSPVGIVQMQGAMRYKSTSAVNAVQFLFDTGNVASGTISITGRPLN